MLFVFIEFLIECIYDLGQLCNFLFCVPYELYELVCDLFVKLFS